MLEFTVVIPARLASSRLPRKVLADVCGKPMLQLTYEQALKSSATQIVIATDSDEVARVAEGFGATVCMTAADHPSGTTRLNEVAQHCRWPDSHIVVNVQADEPLIAPVLIDSVAQNLIDHPWADCASLSKALDSAEANNPNRVKVVSDQQGQALYFSRAAIPYAMDGQPSYQQHIGLYAYRVSLLAKYQAWRETPLESHERLEQLRILYNGGKIHIGLAQADPGPGIDTAEDLAALIAKVSAADAL